MQLSMKRAAIGRLLIPAITGLVIGLASDPHPAVFAFCAITVPWFILRKQGAEKGGVVCALAFALPVCASMLSKAVLSPEIRTVGFVLTALLLSPVAATLGVVGLHFSGAEEKVEGIAQSSEQAVEEESVDEARVWMTKVASAAVLADQYVESKTEGVIIR